MALSKLLFPAPDGPRIAESSPALNRPLTFFKMSRPPVKDKYI